MRRVLVLAIVLAGPAVTAAPKQTRTWPAMCAKVNPVKLGQMILAARRQAAAGLDEKDFSKYEDWNERKTELIVDQKMWQYLCTEE